MCFDMWPWASSRIQAKLQNLQLAEEKLLEIAKRFHPTASTELKIHETWIPRERIPLKTHTDASYNHNKEEYLIHGVSTENQEAPEKTPLVLLHGYLNGGAYFYRNLHGLAQYFSKIHALDMLGWGLSSRPKFYLLEKSTRAAENFFVESLEAWRETNNIERMILGGHSMGGYLATAYCERYPERVERLILISPVGVPYESEDAVRQRTERFRTSFRARTMFGFYNFLYERYYSIGDIARALPERSSRSYIERYVTYRMPSISDEEEQKAISSYLYENASLPGSGEYVLHHTLNPFAFAKEPLVDRIPNLKVSNIAFLYGVSDWMDPVGGLQVKEKKGSHQNVEVFSVSNAGHLLMLENPVEFNTAMVLSAGLIPTHEVKQSPTRL